MKKYKFLGLLSVLMLGFLVGCGSDNSEPTMPELNISFDDMTFIADGTEKNLAITGDLPEGYSVVYENNGATTYGDYYVTANIMDGKDKEVAEYYAVLTIDNPNNESFDEFLDEFFVWYLEGDQLSCNIFLDNPASFGLERYPAEWYSYSETTAADIEEYKAEFDEVIAELNAFDFNSLSKNQRTAYYELDYFLDYYDQYYEIDNVLLMNNSYVNQFGGYVADFLSLVEAYTIRCKEDAQDIIDLVLSTKDSFNSYVEFANVRTEAGFPFSDYTLNEMITYLDEVLTEGDNHYVIGALCAKLEATEYLTDDEKVAYCASLKDAFTNSFFVGVSDLKAGLEALIGSLTSREGYWNRYAGGKDLFVLELEELLGVKDLDIEKYIEQLDSEIADTSRAVSAYTNNLVSNYGITTYDELNALLATQLICDDTPEKMVEFLRDFATNIVPKLDNDPNIIIKEMDEASAKVSNAVAYYTKSTIDKVATEYITLNPTKLGDKNDVLGTLAHEGYPGHLFAFCFLKQSDLHPLLKVMTSTAHGEGWATYVEIALYKHIMDTTDNKKLKDCISYLYASSLAGFLLETRLDIGIHYEGMNKTKVSKYL